MRENAILKIYLFSFNPRSVSKQNTPNPSENAKKMPGMM